MIEKGIHFLHRLLFYHRSALALGRGAASSTLRAIDETAPTTWEFGGFSQNGEDGVIDHLIGKLHHCDRRFLEIGSSDGLENNTAWLAMTRNFSGVMIEGSQKLSRRSNTFLSGKCLGVESVNMFVNLKSVPAILELAGTLNPDVMSLDIDGVDFFIAQALFESHFRPKIVVVEFNGTFGPNRSLTVPYKEDFSYYREHASGLYFGASVAAWKKLFGVYGYRFVTVESNGINAFFVDPQWFDLAFVERISGLPYADNFFHVRQFKLDWEKRFDLIKHLEFVRV